MAINDRLVYRHRRKSDNKVFYIGIGDKTRAYCKTNRNKFWRNTVSKHGYYVEIIAENLSREDACELEIFLIELYGRRIDNKGCLVNISAGGDTGNAKAFRDKSWRSNISKGLTGKKLSESHKKKLSLIKKGKPSNNRRKIINKNTNKIYNSVTEAAKSIGISRSSLANRLCGITKNNTNLEYYEYK